MPQKIDFQTDQKIDFEPIDFEPEEDKSLYIKAWEALTNPLTEIPSRAARAISEYVPEGGIPTGQFSLPSPVARGVINAGGDLASGLTSPLNVGLTIASGGSNLAGRAGYSALARGLNIGEKVLSAPVAAEGAYNTFGPNSTLTERALGLLELGGGVLGLTSKVHVRAGEAPKSIDLKPEAPKAPKIDFEGVELKPASYMNANEITTGTGSKITNKSVEGVTTARDANFGVTKEPPSTLSTVNTVNPSKPSQVLKTEPYREGMPLRKNQHIVKPYPYNVVPDQFTPKPWNFVEQMTPTHIADSPIHSTIPRVVEAAESTRMNLDAQDRAIAAGVPTEEAKNVLVTPEVNVSNEEVVKLVSDLRARTDVTNLEKVIATRALGRILLGKAPTRNEFNVVSRVYGHEDLMRIVKALPRKDVEINYIADRFNLARALQTGYDLSFPLRQGRRMIYTKSWWTSWSDMVKGLGSDDTARAILDSIREREMFRPRVVEQNGRVVALPSYAEEAGLNVTDMDYVREEASGSNLAERIPVWGRGIRASNRAFTVYRNKLVADVFESMINDSRTAYKNGKILFKDNAKKLAKIELQNPDTNLSLRRDIAAYVNNASGRASLDFSMSAHMPNMFGKKGFDLKIPGNLEKHATLLNTILYSPRMIASHLKMLNPYNYAFTPKPVRIAYWKSLAASAAMTMTMNELISQISGEPDFASEVLNLGPQADLSNADFMKGKIGDTRVDTGGGELQYLVYMWRMLNGITTSSTTNKTMELNSGFNRPTAWQLTSDAVMNKTNPLINFVYKWMNREKGYKPFYLADEAMKLVVPLVMQDILDVAKEDPRLIPLGGLSGVGAGVQTYNRRPEALFFGPGGAFLDYQP